MSKSLKSSYNGANVIELYLEVVYIHLDGFLRTNAENSW